MTAADGWFWGALASGMVTFIVIACNGSPAYTPADLKGDQHDEALAKGCQSLCLSDAGCTPTQAAACFDAIICNRSGSLHRHGAVDMTDGGAGCVPQ